MRKILIIFVLLWVAVITWFSSQPLKQSTEQTYAFLVKMNLADHQDLVRSSTEEIKTLKHLTRKAAHFGLYFGLGTLMGLVFYGVMKLRGQQWFVWSWAWGSLWGVIDEIHQFFVPGRSMQWQDMLLDSTGVLMAVCALAVALKLYERLKASKLEEARVLGMEEIY